MNHYTIHQGDCLYILPTLPAHSVHTIVTSPPYYGLRDYGVAGQIGLEPTLDAYITTMVDVFNCLRRVLRDDGTAWLNLGDSYASSAMPNLSDIIQRYLKSGVLFFGCTDPRGSSAQSIHVLIQDKTAPDNVLVPFLTAKCVRVKNGQDNFCEIGGRLDTPVLCWASRSFLAGHPHNANLKCFMNVPKDIRIVVTTGNLNPDTAFGVPTSLSIKYSETSFAIEVTSKPVSEGITGSIPTVDSFTLDTGTECATNIDAVLQSVPLLDSSNFSACFPSNFTVRESTRQKVVLDLHGGIELCFGSVWHLSLLLDRIMPYGYLLEKAIQHRNETQSKQELGVPDLVKRALMRDGWICRQTIIWHKPNPMPESVTDRCTKSHEYLFLLTKSERYYFDAEAIKEPATGHIAGNKTNASAEAYAAGDEHHRTKTGLVKFADKQRASRDNFKRQNGPQIRLVPGSNNNQHREERDDSAYDLTTRNRRSVWTIPVSSYSEAHFATFPAKLVEPCILAGAPAGGVVLDPFTGSGTTGAVALAHGRRFVGIELNPEYVAMANRRIGATQPALFGL